MWANCLELAGLGDDDLRDVSGQNHETGGVNPVMEAREPQEGAGMRRPRSRVRALLSAGTLEVSTAEDCLGTRFRQCWSLVKGSNAPCRAVGVEVSTAEDCSIRSLKSPSQRGGEGVSRTTVIELETAIQTSRNSVRDNELHGSVDPGLHVIIYWHREASD